MKRVIFIAAALLATFALLGGPAGSASAEDSAAPFQVEVQVNLAKGKDGKFVVEVGQYEDSIRHMQGGAVNGKG